MRALNVFGISMPVISYDRLMNTGPCLCTICHRWQHTGVVHLSRHADGKVAFEDIPMFGEYRPVCHKFSGNVIGNYFKSANLPYRRSNENGGFVT